MQGYLKMLWAAVSPFTEESVPLLGKLGKVGNVGTRPDAAGDLEACGQGGSGRVVVVCEPTSPFVEYDMVEHVVHDVNCV
jgi:hypothetical protein